MNYKVTSFHKANEHNHDFAFFVLNIQPATIQNFDPKNQDANNFKQPNGELFNPDLEPHHRIVFQYPTRSDKTHTNFKYFLGSILQSISVSQGILGEEPDILELKVENKAAHKNKYQQNEQWAIQGLDLTSQPSKQEDHTKFNCFIKVLDENFAICVILDSAVPKNIGYFARASF